MPAAKRIALIALLLPVAEIAVIVLMISATGFLKTALLMVLTSLAGALILRRVGRAGIVQARNEMAERGATVRTVRGDEFFTVLGGFLLVLPGFITDAAGALLLLPPVRRGIGAAIWRWLEGLGTNSANAPVVDLEPDQWRRHPDRSLPKGKYPPDRSIGG